MQRYAYDNKVIKNENRGKMSAFTLIGSLFFQVILNELKLAKRSSQVLREDCDDWLSSKLKTRLDHLAENLGSCEGVTPLAFFVLDRPSTLSAVGLLVTYFVVLLQFDAAS
jgi:hypothetical protein